MTVYAAWHDICASGAPSDHVHGVTHSASITSAPRISSSEKLAWSEAILPLRMPIASGAVSEAETTIPLTMIRLYGLVLILTR